MKGHFTNFSRNFRKAATASCYQSYLCIYFTYFSLECTADRSLRLLSTILKNSEHM
jgi:hypothetical protein